MFKIKINLIVTAMAIFFLGCQTATPYQTREKEKNQFGFSDKKISDDFYRVSFKGNENTSKNEVEVKMLYRAAEVTEKSGYKYFTFDDLDVKKTVEIEPYYYRNTFDLTPTFANTTTPYRVTYYTNGYAWVPGATGRQIDVTNRYKVVGFVRMFKEKPKTLTSVNAKSIQEKIEKNSDIR